MSASQDIRIEPTTEEQDLLDSFNCISNAFGTQANDGIWTHMNPGWDTPEGHARCAARLAARLRTITKDRNGRPNIVFLKATVPDPAVPADGSGDAKRIIVGIATWVQLSVVEGYGDRPAEDLAQAVDLEDLYPGSEADQRLCRQLDAALHADRIRVVKDKAAAAASPPAVMVLDMCAVHSEYQRRGIATRLVQWGVEEARARGGLECLTEASSMGRHVYLRLGFRQVGEEMEYGTVDEEVRSKRTLPSNIFMRTGA
ncbi:hypothetical protein SODALDRAFT_326117 [Sodiomyces alkalinus F11]|uniref:N-acetyltransferase domain-containing protein n=1 Tax=Sodiomyces alkalinus (strain CBS 110278 / VKM F-3762 / F11) TaxID=1314773 RepID=A0A3N2Q587_SODAK|nr:hypothetical protein SODALDRAFT_326117 [Sodiomyces alkalinus F11]ROT41933.1 hypothetical protein SODALDRAFT_326117 [Sodiomyces alkalinus F11]